MRARGCLLAGCAFLAACGSIEWLEHPAGVAAQWRGRHALHTERAWVLATSRSAAADVHDQATAALDVAVQAGIAPGPGLLIAVSFDDAALVADADELSHTLGNWHARATGKPPIRAKVPLSRMRARAPFDLSLLFKMRAVGVPMENELELPPTILDRVRWIAVVPTRDCVSAIADEILEKSLAEADLSFFQRLLIAPMLPFARSKVVDEALIDIRGQLLEVLLFPATDGATRKKVLREWNATVDRDPDPGFRPDAVRRVLRRAP